MRGIVVISTILSILLCLHCSLCYPVKENTPPSVYIEGYDCVHHVPKISTLSLEDVEECVEIPHTTNLTTHNVQLIQKRSIKEIMTSTCMLTRSYILFYCGMHSHTSLVKTNLVEDTVPMEQSTCRHLSRTGNISLERGLVLAHVKMNSTKVQNFVQYGAVRQDGTCVGSSFVFLGASYTKHVLDVTYKVLLSERLASLILETKTVNLEDSLSCSYSEGFCTDSTSGTHVWNTTDVSCQLDEYDVLYEGIANMTTSSGQGGVLTINSGDFIFAASIKEPTRVCGIKVESTAVEGVFLSEKTGKFFQFQKTDILPVNALMTRYINAKVGFHAYQASLTSQEIYHKLLSQSCQTNRQILKAYAEIIRNDPTSTSRLGVAEKGVMARAAGSVVHIMKCESVQVSLRMADLCYQEIPVLYNGSEYFLTPQDHILLAEGVQTPCSDAAPPMHQIHGQWYAFTPWPVRRITPGKLTPSVIPGRTYEFDWSTINLGVYSQKTLDNLQQFMMFGPRTKAFTSSTTADSFGIPTSDNYHLGNYISTDQINAFKQAFLGVFHKIRDVGAIVSFFLGLFTIFHLIKYCYDMIQRGLFLKAMGKTGCNICAILSGTVFQITSLMKTSLSKDESCTQEGEVVTTTYPKLLEMEKSQENSFYRASH